MSFFVCDPKAFEGLYSSHEPMGRQVHVASFISLYIIIPLVMSRSLIMQFSECDWNQIVGK